VDAINAATLIFVRDFIFLFGLLTYFINKN